MSEKTNFEAMQINDEELDLVVGGQEVLSLQSMNPEGVSAAGCLSWCSCSSSVSSKSDAVKIE
jgi:hypothetical protein